MAQFFLLDDNAPQIQPTIALGAQVMVPIVWRCVSGVMPVVFMVLTAGHPVSSSSWMVKEWVPYLWNRRLGRCGEWMEKHGVQAVSASHGERCYICYTDIHVYIYIRMYFHNGTEKTERNRTYKTMIFTRLLDLQHVICTYNCIYCNYTNWQASFIQNTIGVHIFYFWEYVNIVCINHVKKTMTNLTSPCGDSTKQQPVSGGLLGRLGFSARESWYPTSQKRGNSSAGCAQIYEQQFCIWAAKKVVMLKSWGSGVVRCWNLMVGCEVEVDLYANCLRIGNESMNWTLEEHGRTIIMEGCIFRRQTAPDLGSGDWA